MKYSVDRVEGDVVVLQNLTDRSMSEVKKEAFSFEVKEKDIIVLENGCYFLDLNAKEERLKKIKEKMNKLKDWK